MRSLMDLNRTQSDDPGLGVFSKILQGNQGIIFARNPGDGYGHGFLLVLLVMLS